MTGARSGIAPRRAGPPSTRPPPRRAGGRRRLAPRHIVRDGRCGRRRGGVSGAAVRAGDVGADGSHGGHGGNTNRRALGGEWGWSPRLRGRRSHAGCGGRGRSRTDACAGAVCRVCAAAAVVTPMTAVVRPSAAPAARLGALSSMTMGRERLLEHSITMCLRCPVERHRRTSPQNTVHASDQIDFPGGLNASPSF